jgi:putative ABC transport system permease protein
VAASWPVLAAVLGGLIMLTGLVAGLGRLGVTRQAVTASVRAVVQLGAVSTIIAAVLRSAGLTCAFITFMYLIATLTSARRITGHRSGRWAGLAIAAGVVPVLALLLGTGLVATKPVAVLPIAGILIGGGMTATGLGGRRALDDLLRRRDEYEARLALGFPGRVARRAVARPAAAQALLPAIDQTRTVGLVTLPGAFVGVLLGGASPVQAGVTQVLVLVGLLAIETVAVLVVVELVAAGLIRPEPADPARREASTRWLVLPGRRRLAGDWGGSRDAEAGQRRSDRGRTGTVTPGRR